MGAEQETRGQLGPGLTPEASQRVQALADENEKLRALLGNAEAHARRVAAEAEALTAENERLEAQLLQARKLAVLGELAAGLTHEITQPLQAIRIFAQTLLRRAEAAGGPGNDDAALLRQIAEQIDRMTQIVRRMRTSAREDGGRTGSFDPGEAVRAAPKPAAPDRRRVLLIEDEAVIALALKKELEAAGFEVRMAPSGEQALRALPRFRPDAIVTDLGLQGLGGEPLVRMLRERGGGAPVIVLSGYFSAADERAFATAGAAAALSKPVAPDRLASTLRSLLERPGAP